MVSDRNANATEFGWQFQIFSGIVAALNDINNIKSINIEGVEQDVELEQNNGNKILIQAKAYTKADINDTNATEWGEKLASAMNGLLENYVDDKRNILKYYVNFPYPFGVKRKGSKSNFSIGNYGEIYGTELNDVQKRIIKDKIASYIDEGKSRITKAQLKDNYSNFISKIIIRNCLFTNFRDKNRKYEQLDSLIKEFLEKNKLDVSVKRLRDYWIAEAFDNGSYKVSIDRDNFLFGIIIVKNSFSSHELMGRRIGHNKVINLYDRFRSIIDRTFALEEFNRMLISDILHLENIQNINEYNYDEETISKLINKVYVKYEPYFSLENISHTEVEELTKYALQHFLLEEDIINKLLRGELLNVD